MNSSKQVPESEIWVGDSKAWEDSERAQVIRFARATTASQRLRMAMELLDAANPSTLRATRRAAEKLRGNGGW